MSLSLPTLFLMLNLTKRKKKKKPKILSMKTLQGKDPLAEVIKEVFSVIKLAKIVKKTYATTFVYGYEGFGGAFNGNSTQLKNNGRPEVITDVFFVGVLLFL